MERTEGMSWQELEKIIDKLWPTIIFKPAAIDDIKQIKDWYRLQERGWKQEILFRKKNYKLLNIQKNDATIYTR